MRLFLLGLGANGAGETIEPITHAGVVCGLADLGEAVALRAIFMQWRVMGCHSLQGCVQRDPLVHEVEGLLDIQGQVAAIAETAIRIGLWMPPGLSATS